MVADPTRGMQEFSSRARKAKRAATFLGDDKGGKVEKTMGEFKRGTLHSGSKKGPVVKGRKQAVAIALAQARREKKG